MKPVATQRHHHVGSRQLGLAVQGNQLRHRGLRRGRRAGPEGDTDACQAGLSLLGLRRRTSPQL